MLRTVVALLLIANLGFYAWTHGWLDAVVGVPAQGGREPERLSRQLRPESIRILSPGALPAAQAPAATPPAPPAGAASSAPMSLLSRGPNQPACLQTGPLTPAEAVRTEAQLRADLPSLEPGSLVNVAVETPGVWLIYLGRFANREALSKKQDELRRVAHVVGDEVRELPQLEPGLVLGHHASRAAAQANLAQLTERGVRGARVLALSPAATLHTLRFERADEALRTQLQAFGNGSAFLPCPNDNTTLTLSARAAR